MNIMQELRDLAKTSYYQTLFSTAKQLNLQIFNNNKDFSTLQIMFLSYLNFYKVLFEEIAHDEVSELVLKKHLYEDAYMQFRSENYKRAKRQSEKSSEPMPRASKGKSKINNSWRIDMHKGKMK